MNILSLFFVLTFLIQYLLVFLLFCLNVLYFISLLEIYICMYLSFYLCSCQSTFNRDGDCCIIRCVGGNKWTRTTDIKMLMWVRILFPERLATFWWEQVDSNHRPHAYQACALTSWAMFPYKLFCSSVPKVESASLWAINSYQLLVVEVSGIEPLTPCLQGRCSPSWAIPPTCL